MTVKKLIEQLQQRDPNQLAYFRSGKKIFLITIVQGNEGLKLTELTNEEHQRPIK